MRFVEPEERQAQRFGHRLLHAGVLATSAAQRADGVFLGTESDVVPPLDGHPGIAYGLTRDRMEPALLRQRTQRRLQLPMLGRRAQERSDDGEAKSRPKKWRARSRRS